MDAGSLIGRSEPPYVAFLVVVSYLCGVTAACCWISVSLEAGLPMPKASAGAIYALIVGLSLSAAGVASSWLGSLLRRVQTAELDMCRAGVQGEITGLKAQIADLNARRETQALALNHVFAAMPPELRDSLGQLPAVAAWRNMSPRSVS